MKLTKRQQSEHKAATKYQRKCRLVINERDVLPSTLAALFYHSAN